MTLSKIFKFMAAVLVCLALLCVCFPREGITVGSLTLRFPTLHKILVKEHKPTLEEILRQEAEEQHQRELSGLQDSILYLQQLQDSSVLRFWFPHNDYLFFDALFADMEEAMPKGRTLRVVHYGDSQIEMDRMTQQLRTYFQEHFGGGGPGMQPAWQTISSYAVSQRTSGAWTLLSSYGDSLTHRAQGNYGPLARCARLAGDGNIFFSASKQSFVDDRVRHFRDVTIVYNNHGGSLSVTLSGAENGGNSTTVWSRQEEREGVHALSWHLQQPVGTLRLSLKGNADIYCVLVDDGPGVAVDNVPLRGCSGQQFTMINRDQLQEAYARMDVGLIILQFGGNSVPYLKGQKNVEVYAASIGRQIDRLHEVCPAAKILFVGPSDMSTTLQGERQSYPFLAQTVAMLRDTVLQHNAAFWSIYDAMGGHNSMLAWVEGGLAGSDYIHFSTKGARMMGERFAEAFDNMYRLYLLRKRKAATEADTTYLEAALVENNN